jgi:hypothetical protein
MQSLQILRLRRSSSWEPRTDDVGSSTVNCLYVCRFLQPSSVSIAHSLTVQQVSSEEVTKDPQVTFSCLGSAAWKHGSLRSRLPDALISTIRGARTVEAWAIELLMDISIPTADSP